MARKGSATIGSQFLSLRLRTSTHLNSNIHSVKFARAPAASSRKGDHREPIPHPQIHPLCIRCKLIHPHNFLFKIAPDYTIYNCIKIVKFRASKATQQQKLRQSIARISKISKASASTPSASSSRNGQKTPIFVSKLDIIAYICVNRDTCRLTSKHLFELQSGAK